VSEPPTGFSEGSLDSDRAERLLRDAASDLESLDPGTRIGAFTLRREIGRGAYGVVFEADQDTPLARRVAVKVLRLDSLGRRNLQRFMLEQRLLANLSHPGIAQVFDTGALEDGRPWFAMEFVQGSSIEAFVRERGLDRDARLELLAEACDAVAYAHRKGVIHRDLKPGNVLVSETDGGACVKVVDFGVSRAFMEGGGLPGTTAERLTEIGQLIGTLEFMSPEVATQGAEAATPRSDLYALGVIACCVLAGELPIDPGDARVTPLDERLRRIRLEPARRPSAIARSGGVGTLQPRHLRGDIDGLIEKCLSKDPAQRHGSAAELARDLRRIAAGEAVDLPNQSPATRLRRFGWRHRAALTIGAMTFVSAIGITGLVGWFAWREALARRSAEQALADARAADARTSEVVVGLWDAIGPVRKRIQFGADAGLNVAMMQSVRNLFVHVFGPDHARTDTAVREYARTLAAAGRLQEAADVYLEALPGWETRGGADHPKLIPVRTEIAECLRRGRQPDQAIPLFSAVIQQSEAIGAESPVQAARRGLAICLSDVGRHDEAIETAQEALMRLTLMPPPDVMDRAFLEGVLASIYRYAGRMTDAEALYRELLSPERQERLKLHPQFRLAMGAWAGELGMLLHSEDRMDEAKPWVAMGLRLMRDEASRVNPTARWLRENAGCYGLCDDGSPVPTELANRIDP
jgi:serine/threonine protein kinase/tetratricopeptide (TPR) repeat protein